MLEVAHVDHGADASERSYYFLSENILAGFDQPFWRYYL